MIVALISQALKYKELLTAKYPTIKIVANCEALDLTGLLEQNHLFKHLN
jgi:hypothetical protein